LMVFPFLELLCLLIAWRVLPQGIWASAVFVLLAASAMTYSLHIVFHEVVHQRFFRHPVAKLLCESAITALLGTPFNEYRQSHWRHHRFTNLLEDSTSTWKDTPAGPKPRNVFAYVLGWPLLARKDLTDLWSERRLGLQTADTVARVVFELVLLGAIHTSLMLYSMPLWFIYSCTVYLGWAGIAAVNYIQHPPVEYGSGYTASIYSPTYNTLFYNNGLHFEHHYLIQEPVIQLSPMPGDWRLYKDGKRIRLQREDGAVGSLEETYVGIPGYGRQSSDRPVPPVRT
jgi:fatty acid desaturase